MALISCAECSKEISDKAAACPHCGAPVASVAQSGPTFAAPASQPQTQLVKSAKSRGIYIILGLFFGLLGIHNFYAGRLGVGVAQLLVTCILGWFVVGIFITAIWVLIELFTVTEDGAGDAFA
jgi:TM2 domain-containing membrane protein YozV